MGSTTTEEAYCLKWNDFQSSITSSFAELRNDPDLLDAVIVCEGQLLRAHRLVLSACSGVFRQLFRMSASVTAKTDHPVVLLWDVKADDLRLLFTFMYEGQVNVAQDRLTNFLLLAERLAVRGLTSTSSSTSAAPVSSAAPSTTFAPQCPVVDPVKTGILNQPILHPPQAPLPATMVINNRSPAKNSSTPSVAVGRRLRSTPLGTLSPIQSDMPLPSKRLRPSASHSGMDDSNVTTISDSDIDDSPLPVKQELKVDENSTVITAAISGPPLPVMMNLNADMSGRGNQFYSGSSSEPEAQNDSAGPSSYNLEPGTMIEEGSKEFMESVQNGTCPYCTKFFRHRWNVMRHVQDVHHEDITPCPSCGKTFASKSKMQRHFLKRCRPKNGDAENQSS